MRSFFTFVVGALAMLAVALVAMFITMRVAIHGREALVPPLTGRSVADADAAAARVGLRLTIENSFYSDAPAGRVLAQDPAPGSRVRREWAVRVTESLGAQRISVPDLTGESERAANITIRRLGLEPSAVARLAVPGDADVVIAQTPAPNSVGADSPRVGLLVSDPADVQPQAYVMPQLVGLTYTVAVDRASAAGLHLQVAQPVPGSVAAGGRSITAETSQPANAPQLSATLPHSIATLPAAPVAAVVHPGSIISAQVPQTGRRVQQGDAIHVSLEDSPPPPPPIAGPRTN